MNVYPYRSDIPHLKRVVVTLGTFDGVHHGHRQIIRYLVERAEKLKGNSLIVTFDKHPLKVIKDGDGSVENLTTLNEKITIMESLGVRNVLLIPFTRTLSQYEPELFLKEMLLDKMEIQEFVIGYDHAFGSHRKGDRNFLIGLGKKLGFSVHVVKPVRIGKEVVSSTRIRQLLYQGEIRSANRMLGSNYSIRGIVKKGEEMARQWGVPTANLFQSEDHQKLIPRNGIYAVLVHTGQDRFQGVCYIGTRPTLNGNQRQIEIHLHDFQGDLYDQELTVEFIDFIREEKKFENIDVMVSEIKKDREKSIKILSKIA
jgi:riboflavin kinase/FMN adenylyltransferase